MEFRSHLMVALRVNGRDGEVAVGVRTALLDLLRDQPDFDQVPATQGERR
jgi:aerobic-type carbon monoxide dehydrogenase small subunit (CoxS/CutS family)